MFIMIAKVYLRQSLRFISAVHIKSYLDCNILRFFLAFPVLHERLRNQRPTLVVSPDVSTRFKEIWIGNVLLLGTFLVKFLPAPEPFRRKDAFNLFQPKTDLFSTRALILVHFKTVRYFSQPIFILFSY